MARAQSGAQDRLANSRRSAQDREDVIKELERTGFDLQAALTKCEVKLGTYKKWRSRYPDFAARCEALKPGARAKPGKAYTAGFGPFQKEYLGMEAPAFHLEAIDAYETTPPGNIAMFLFAPEHGKTTMFENFSTKQCSTSPNWRCTVGSEKLTMARKILQRVKRRLETNYRLIADFGPFRAERGVDRATQAWAADFFRVWKATHDERDYTMAAVGFGAAVAGTRTDHLHVDDVQSLKSLGQTESMVNEFRQDWLSRPGEDGITTINGTRVGEGDFYEAIEEAMPPDILRIVRFPAIVRDPVTDEMRPLWPEKYTMAQLERIRIKVGEEAWFRNFMQAPRSTGAKTFTDAIIEPSLNKLRSLRMAPQRGLPIVFALDPALGGFTTLLGAQFTGDQLALVYLHERSGLGRNEELFAMIRDGAEWAKRHHCPASDVIIEANAMQKGLARDDRLWEMADLHGFEVREHLTGVQKYDSAIGIPSMATDLRLANVDLPYAGDDVTRYEMDELIRQLKKWRPNVKGTVLRQDRVMALWFLWILWRARRGTQPVRDSNQFDRQGLDGFVTTASGLSVPGRAIVEQSYVLSGRGLG